MTDWNNLKRNARHTITLLVLMLTLITPGIPAGAQGTPSDPPQAHEHDWDTLEYWESYRVLPGVVRYIDREGVQILSRDRHGKQLVAVFSVNQETKFPEGAVKKGDGVFVAYCREDHLALSVTRANLRKGSELSQR